MLRFVVSGNLMRMPVAVTCAGTGREGNEYQNRDPKRSLAFLAYRVISHVLRSSCVATAYRLIILRLERNKAGKDADYGATSDVRRKYQRRCCLLHVLVKRREPEAYRRLPRQRFMVCCALALLLLGSGLLLTTKAFATDVALP